LDISGTDAIPLAYQFKGGRRRRNFRRADNRKGKKKKGLVHRNHVAFSFLSSRGTGRSHPKKLTGTTWPREVSSKKGKEKVLQVENRAAVKLYVRAPRAGNLISYYRQEAKKNEARWILHLRKGEEERASSAQQRG